LPPDPVLNPSGIKQGVGQFRSPIRDLNGFQSTYTSAKTFLTGPETIFLRSLLASVNAKDLRDSGDNVELAAVSGFPASFIDATKGVNVFAYGTERQVFITEVYANNEVNAPMYLDPTAIPNGGRQNPNYGKTNPKGYVAVEIYNPYDYPVDLTWWTLVVVTRSATGVTAAPISKFNGFNNGDGQNAIIQPKHYMVLENFPVNVPGQSPNDATYRPYSNGAYTGYTPAIPDPPASASYYVPNLHEVLQDSASGKPGGELVLVRQPYAHGKNDLPQTATDVDPGAAGLGGDTPGTAKFNQDLATFAPVDSFDFSGMPVGVVLKDSPLMAIHYVRPNPGNNNTLNSNTNWKFVYPGRWDPTKYAPYRQEGVQASNWAEPDPMAMPQMPPDAGHYDRWDNFQSGMPMPIPLALGVATGHPVGSYANPFPGIQLNNTDMGGPNKLLLSQSTPYKFPFGGFARVGDVLQVPFIGSYMIFSADGTQLLEMNPVTRDAAAADDWDPNTPSTTADDSIEQIGRFCPILALQQSAAGAENIIPPLDGGNPPQPSYDPYGWAAHVMDYFSAIQNPNDDYFPNVDPAVYALGPWNMAALSYPASGGGLVANQVANITNTANGPNLGTEDLVPNEGLININTASWRVLAAVPWVPTNGTTASGPTVDNQNIAQAIVNFRNTYGPFKTLFDLNKVPLLTSTYFPLNPKPVSSGATALQNYYGNPNGTDYGPDAGDISPLWSIALPSGAWQSDNMTNDFETRMAMINRVSNLLTTRSDTYTVYVLVQGWSGVGTGTPNLVVQRRAAFIADRTQLTPSNQTLHIVPVQAN
jgi:hypothetical protein